jgi:filamentous hemagglutinin family protein
MRFPLDATSRTSLKSSASFCGARLLVSGAGVLFVLPALISPAQANPAGGQVTTGSAAIAAPSSGSTTIRQTSEDVVIDWSSFNIGSGQTAEFVQPNSSAIAVNRISGANPGTILGTLDANGRVVLIDGNGILFGKNARVNVGALVATSTDGSDPDLLAGKFTKAGNQNASVVNLGTITTAGGTVALVAPNVSNAGTVRAKLGTISLGAANAFTIDFAGDGLIAFAAQGDVNARATAANTGMLSGARVSLTAHAAEDVATGVVNVSGTIEAQGLHETGGTIVLDAGNGGDVAVTHANLDASGTTGGGSVAIGGWNENSVAVDRSSVIDASAGATGNGGSIAVIASNTSFEGRAVARGGIQSGNGGAIETSGDVLDISGAHVDTLASRGSTGSWSLDPENVTISTAATTNGAISGGVFTPSGDNSIFNVITLENALGTTNVTVTTGSTGSQAGDITVLAPVSWSSHTLTLDAFHSIDIDASLSATGTAGLALVTNDGGTGGDYYFNGGNVTFANTGEALSINGQTYTLLTSMSGVQAINASDTSLDGYYALAQSLNGNTTSTWTPIGTDGAGNPNNSYNGFGGTFTGLGNTISNLVIDNPSVNFEGLFGASTGTIRDIGVVGGLVEGREYVGALVGANYGTIEGAFSAGPVGGTQNVGGLAGYNSGSIAGSYATAAVSGASSSAAVGGLVGYNASGTIGNSYAAGPVTAGIGSSEVGGLVGLATGPDNNGGGTIANSFANGSVSVGSNSTDIGGLVGLDGGDISASYSTGAVSGNGGSDIGGLVGNAQLGSFESFTAESITDSYTTSAVIGGGGSNNVGGLVGYEDEGAVSNSFAIGSVAGSTNVGGIVGLNYYGTFTNDYFDIQTTGQGTAGTSSGITGTPPPGTGVTTAQLQGTLPAGFDSSIWGTASGLFPYFLWQYPISGGTPQAVSGTLFNYGGATAPINILDNGVSITPSSVSIAPEDGYYYLLLPPNSIADGTAIVVYTTGANAAASVYTVTGSLIDVDLWDRALIAPTSDTTYTSAIATSLQTQDAALISQAAGSNSAAKSLVAGLTNYGYVATGSGFTINEPLSPGNGLFVQTIANNANVTLADPLTLPGGEDAALSASGNLLINAYISGSGTLVLATAGAGHNIILDGAVTAGTLDLESGGAISQSSAGTITSDILMGSASGNVALTEANAIGAVGFFATNNGNFALTDTDALTLNSQIDTGTGNLGLTTSGGALTINGTLSGGTVSLNANGPINSGANGIVNATTLTGSADGAVALSNSNAIDNLGIFATNNGDFSLTDANSLTVTGAVNAGTGDLTLIAGTGIGVTMPGYIWVTSNPPADIAVDAPLSGASMELGSTGTISQNSSGIVTTSYLTGYSQGNTILNAANKIAEIYFDTAQFQTDGNFSLTNAQSITAKVDAGTGSLSLTTTGAGNDMTIQSFLTGAAMDLSSAGMIDETSGTVITAATLTGKAAGQATFNGANAIGTLDGFAVTGGAFELSDNQSLAIAGAVSATNDNVALNVTGSITETGLGAIAAGSFQGSSTAAAALNGTNVIAAIDGFTNSGSGGFSLTDDTTLAVDGAINAGSGDIALTTFGAGHNLSIAQALTTKGTATLTSAGTILSSAVITAYTLTGYSTGNALLAQNGAVDSVASIGPFTTNNGAFSVTDVLPFSSSPQIEGAIDTGTGSLTLNSPGPNTAWFIEAPLTGGTVDIEASGPIDQLATGAITAKTLTGSVGYAAGLTADNAISNLGAFTVGNGDLSLTDTTSLHVDGAVNVGTGNVTLNVAGDLIISGKVSSGGTVDLAATKKRSLKAARAQSMRQF